MDATHTVFAATTTTTTKIQCTGCSIDANGKSILCTLKNSNPYSNEIRVHWAYFFFQTNFLLIDVDSRRWQWQQLVAAITWFYWDHRLNVQLDLNILHFACNCYYMSLIFCSLLCVWFFMLSLLWSVHKENKKKKMT